MKVRHVMPDGSAKGDRHDLLTDLAGLPEVDAGRRQQLLLMADPVYD